MDAPSPTPADTPRSAKKVLRRSGVDVTVYPTRNRIFRRNSAGELVLAGDHPQFTVTWYEAGERRKRKFTTEPDATHHAQQILSRLSRGLVETTAVSPADRQLLADLRTLCAGIGRQDVLGVVREACDALRLLPAHVPLREAVQFFASRAAQERKTVRQVLQEFLATKERGGKSDRYLDDLKSRLEAFARHHEAPVDALTGPMLQAYLDGLDGSARNRWNHQRVISTLLRFAVRRKWASRDLLDDLAALERPTLAGGTIGILRPEEFSELLHGALLHRPNLVPFAALAGFAGLRTAELMRLEWRSVNVERRFVEVPAAKAKTASRRLVPLGDAAIAWLKRVPREGDRVVPYAEENKVMAGLIDAANRLRRDRHRGSSAIGSDPASEPQPFQWVRNGLRHSFCSYRLAEVKDAARVALEAGNSPGMLFRHYRELVTEDQARAWFSIHPPP